jgi:phosphate transport system substrate-binding protein
MTMSRALQYVLLMAASAAVSAQSLSALPDYQPRQQVRGTIRSSGDRHMDALMRFWEQGFQKFHPEVRFTDSLRGTASGSYGLEMRTADIAVMGRTLNPFERYGTYERSWAFPVQIEVATGSLDTEHKSPALAIFVHKDNPLAKLTVRQLDGIFGAQRGGGWQALSWVESSARTSAENIRSWGRLGIRGRYADKSIHVYGPPLPGAGVITFFQARVFGGGAMWNEDLREYPDPQRMIADLGHDPYGIAYAPLCYGTGAVKAIAIADGPDRYVQPTRSSLADRSYPLSRPVYIDYTIDNAHSDIANPRVEPTVKEFLRYILSRQAQQDVDREGAFVPLPPSVVHAQLEQLDSERPPGERALLDE